MITNSQHQAAWVAYLKSIPATISPVPVVEVREASWKGDVFTYPNIRVRPVSITPDPNPNCPITIGDIAIDVFSEEKSSKECDDIAGAIANYLHGRKFSQSGVKFAGTTVTSLEAAIAESEVVWRSTVNLRTTMS